MTKYSLNFRATAGPWGETPPAGAVLGDLYPASIAGLTCGWSAATTNSNYTTATNAKLSGKNLINSASHYFRIDLPNGPGRYRIWIAVGALSATISNAFIIRDGAGTALRTVASTSITGSTNPALSTVMDVSGALIPYNDYISTDGGTVLEADFTSDHVRIERNGTRLDLANVMLEPVELPLVDAVLSTEFGTGTHSGSIHPKEPQGHRFGKVSSTVGTQSYSIVGSSTYFSLETVGSDTWLVASATRIPDAWTGSVTVRQTSGAQTRDTTFNFTAGTVDRPVTGLLGQVTTETLIQRARVKAVMDAESWPGYAGQTFATDQAVTSGSDLITKLAALPATGWHRLRLQDGTYTGVHYPVQTDWVGSGGGVLIEPDTGHDPTFNCVWEDIRFRGVQFRGLIIVPPSSAVDANFNNGVGAPYAIFQLDQCRIGYGFAPGFDVANWASWGALVLNFEFCEEVHIKDCQIVGISNGFLVSGGRRIRSNGNSFRLVARDFHRFSTAFRFNTPRGVFADDVTYVEITDGTAWHNPDIYTGLTGAATPHSDWLQIGRTGGNAYPTTSAGLNGSASTPWSAGIVGFNPVNSKLYTVVSVTGDALIDPLNPPTGTGTGIVSGNVTFDYLQDYTLATEMVVLLEGNCLLQDGTTINLDGNAQPNVQFVINSNGGWNNTFTFVSVNNISASSNTRGLNCGFEATVHAEWNTFVGGAVKALDNDQAYIEGGTVRAHHNIVGLVSGAPNIVGSDAVAAEGNVAANFKNGAASPNRPGDVMVGPFTDLSPIGWGYSMVDDDTVTAEEFRSNMSKLLHHLTGAAGARLREVHTVTVGADSFPLIVNP